ncbi:MAG: hypothetical protein CMC15_17695 [Flavobacteriaceae bacterium]|nr:hypothetical protein [Flavobacteriaceae bacterium]|tara:strand:- start:45 stop:329 length:285 start_codon:yes stop_codon:yes gene_type:complete
MSDNHNTIKLDPFVFRKLLRKIRDARDPENIEVEVQDEEGTTLVYRNGGLFVLYKKYVQQLEYDSLVKDQRVSLAFVVAEKLKEAVDEIILEAL